MEGEIYWRGYVRVKDKYLARKRFAAMEARLEREVALVSCERYWKIEELFEICFETTWNCETVEEAVFDTLKLSNKLCRDWIVNGPDFYQNGVVTLEGSFHDPNVRIYIPQLEWMLYHFTWEEKEKK